MATSIINPTRDLRLTRMIQATGHFRPPLSPLIPTRKVKGIQRYLGRLHYLEPLLRNTTLQRVVTDYLGSDAIMSGYMSLRLTNDLKKCESWVVYCTQCRV